MLENGDVTCQQLLDIFMERALTIGLEHNLIAQVNYEECKKTAAIL